ncbi:hypothetical protein TNIN_419221 [Trichonephila inaurata madagascariensis]|uniref:Uncharacterized protein n=1 Tax=Trichonephila inaurata madagascariensis TaxID=2747483 RepID=A0A8X6XVU6_9ARAC|nr:hypothetical protein TNIN_419221 [Trichonephila inaurata madagascariensis]
MSLHIESEQVSRHQILFRISQGSFVAVILSVRSQNSKSYKRYENENHIFQLDFICSIRLQRINLCVPKLLEFLKCNLNQHCFDNPLRQKDK